ncbi:hypothetical protein ACTTAF_07650 [Rhodobacter capsulatus]|uniref:hypothetical protein n=1 Tax=Rhodobacter capsulatus TaxID=1061 RepID=UPI004038935F
MADEAHRITTLLPVDAETALPRFEARASAIGFASARIGGRLRVTLSGGTATVGPAPGGTALEVTAEDGPHLQMLRDYLTEELQAAGLRPLWQGPPGDGWPASHARTRWRCSASRPRIDASLWPGPIWRALTRAGCISACFWACGRGLAPYRWQWRDAMAGVLRPGTGPSTRSAIWI